MHLRTAGLIFGAVFLLTPGGCGGGGGTVRDGGGGAGGSPGTGGSGSGGNPGTGGSGSGGNPGTGGSGSGGNPGTDAKVDSPSQPDAGPTDRPSGNACVAAGGTCTATCQAPTSPELNTACAGAAGSICCILRTDAGPSDRPDKRPMIGPDGKFACGNTSCDPKTQYCRGLVGGAGGDSYACQTIPPSCASGATCACVAFGPCGECYESSGAVLQLCGIALAGN